MKEAHRGKHNVGGTSPAPTVTFLAPSSGWVDRDGDCIAAGSRHLRAWARTPAAPCPVRGGGCLVRGASSAHGSVRPNRTPSRLSGAESIWFALCTVGLVLDIGNTARGLLVRRCDGDQASQRRGC